MDTHLTGIIAGHRLLDAFGYVVSRHGQDGTRVTPPPTHIEETEESLEYGEQPEYEAAQLAGDHRDNTHGGLYINHVSLEAYTASLAHHVAVLSIRPQVLVINSCHLTTWCT